MMPSAHRKSQGDADVQSGEVGFVRIFSGLDWECEQKAGALLKEGTGGCFHGHSSDQRGPTVNSSRIRVEIPGSPPIRGCRIPTAAPGSSALLPRCEDLSLIVYSRRNLSFKPQITCKLKEKIWFNLKQAVVMMIRTPQCTINFDAAQKTAKGVGLQIWNLEIWASHPPAVLLGEEKNLWILQFPSNKAKTSTCPQQSDDL